MTVHPDDTYDGGRLCPDVTTKHPGGHHPECCCRQCDPIDDYELRLCGNCCTELGQFETGSFCFDCRGARR